MAWRRIPWRAIADWFSFQLGTVKLWLLRHRPESNADRIIRERGERLRRLFPEQYAHERRRCVANDDDKPPQISRWHP